HSTPPKVSRGLTPSGLPSEGGFETSHDVSRDDAEVARVERLRPLQRHEHAFVASEDALPNRRPWKRDAVKVGDPASAVRNTRAVDEHTVLAKQHMISLLCHDALHQVAGAGGTLSGREPSVTQRLVEE